MREFAVAGKVTVPEQLNITDLLDRQVREDPTNVLFSRRAESGSWEDISARSFQVEVEAVARRLVADGVELGDRVAILSATRYEWVLLDFAVWCAGGVSVPIYETSSTSQIAWILEDSQVKMVFAENHEQLGKVERAVEDESLTGVQHRYLIDDGGLTHLKAAGAEVTDQQLEARRSAADLDGLATIIYTSGTTGRPKGCELTHGNFTEHCLQTLAAMDGVIGRESSTVLFLPMAHVFARFVSIIFVAAGGRVAHTPNIKDLIDDLGEVRPTFLLGVPRVFEKIYNAAVLKADADGRGRIFAKAVDTAVKYSTELSDGKPSLLLRAQHAVFKKLVYSKLLDRMGGNVTHAFSGGSPLGERTARFFHGIGVQIIEGYGLTETTAPVTGNIPSVYRIGTVGTPLPGNAVSLDDDGKVLVQGASLFRGYRGREDLNRESFTEPDSQGVRWFRTGDLGELDEAGRLRITGRKKDIIVTAGGKNVSPGQLEDQIRADVLVSQAVVVGEGRPFVGALITLDPETAASWCRSHRIDEETPLTDLAEHPQVLEHIQNLVSQVNTTVSQAESIRAFTVLAEDFTLESGHLTPSMKVKRADVMRDFAQVVGALYDNASAARDR